MTTQSIEPGPLSRRLARLSARQRQLLADLAAELLLRDPAGATLARVDDPALLARQTADSVLDTAAVWQEHLGPLYDVDGVARLLGHEGRALSRQAVSKRRHLLALRTGSGRVVYPAFQLRNGKVIDGLDRVLDAVPEQLVSRWTLASWLVSPEPDLDGSTPLEVLRAGGIEVVVAVARRWAHALAA